MCRSLLIVCTVIAAAPSVGSAQAAVRVEPADLQGPRPLQEQTEQTAIRDYLQAWQTVGKAFDQNRTDLLGRDFVGTALEQLSDTIQQQSGAGIHTRYQDKSHDLQIVFYSPEGLSIELVDNVSYDVQVLEQDKVMTTQHVQTRYVVVLTPAEVRWRVRVFQGAV